MNRWFGVVFGTVHEENRVRHAPRLLFWTVVSLGRPFGAQARAAMITSRLAVLAMRPPAGD
jgi:hypothetical protein